MNKKELSIKTIKKELIDRMMNNVEVLKYLNIDKYTENGRYNKISDICDALILDYDSGNNAGDFIAIEVGEKEYAFTTRNDRKEYIVSIRIGLYQENELDDLAAIIKNIISDLFPNRNEYKDMPTYSKRSDGYNDLNRLITFVIEE